MNTDKLKRLQRLDFEDIIWIVFIVLAILDLEGDDCLRKAIINDDITEERRANNIFTIIVIVSLIINLYFLGRSYELYKNSKNKELASIKLLGSILFIIGGICLVYFQLNDKTSTIGGPTL